MSRHLVLKKYWTETDRLGNLILVEVFRDTRNGAVIRRTTRL